MKTLMKYASTASAATVLLAAALATPAVASVASHSRTVSKVTTTTGTVIAKDVRRHTLVVTSGSGVVHTIRLAPKVLASARAGEKITARTTSLADGTVRTSALHRVGSATRATIRATIVSSHSGRVLLSAGGSVFAVSTGRVAHSQPDAGTSTGENVDVTVGISQDGLAQMSEQSTGQSNLISLDGVLSAITSSSLTIVVENGASTTVAIPASLTIPSTVAVGDQIEIMADYASQTFTLVTITDDSSAANSQNQGISEGDNQNLQVEGQVIVVSPTSLTVQPGDGAAALTISVPSTVDVSMVVAGDQVQAELAYMAGGLSLTAIEVQQDNNQSSGDQASSEITGVVTALGAGSITVTTTESSTVVTAVVPSTLDASSLVMGATVNLTVEFVAGVLTVTDVSVADSQSTNTSS